MDRRMFIVLGVKGILGGSAVLSAVDSFGETRCTPFNPSNGIQQCESGIDSTLIHSSALQQASEWCWAACIEMVFRYYGFDVPQRRIVTETWGAPVNMPGQPQQILADLNRRWVDEGGKRFRVSGDVLTTGPETAARDLAKNRPLVIGTLGHAVVLTSLIYVKQSNGRGQVISAIARDPWPGRGRRVLAPAEWNAINFAARIRVHRWLL